MPLSNTDDVLALPLYYDLKLRPLPPNFYIFTQTAHSITSLMQLYNIFNVTQSQGKSHNAPNLRENQRMQKRFQQKSDKVRQAKEYQIITDQEFTKLLWVNYLANV